MNLAKSQYQSPSSHTAGEVLMKCYHTTVIVTAASNGITHDRTALLPPPPAPAAILAKSFSFVDCGQP